MPFTLAVARTVNGTERTFRWHGQPDAFRTGVEELIGDFNAGRKPMEGTLTLSVDPNFPAGVGVGSGPDNPEWSRSWRWADIKNIWIEDAS